MCVLCVGVMCTCMCVCGVRVGVVCVCVYSVYHSLYHIHIYIGL